MVSLATPLMGFATQPKVIAGLCMAQPLPFVMFTTTGFHSWPEKSMLPTKRAK